MVIWLEMQLAMEARRQHPGLEVTRKAAYHSQHHGPTSAPTLASALHRTPKARDSIIPIYIHQLESKWPPLNPNSRNTSTNASSSNSTAAEKSSAFSAATMYVPFSFRNATDNPGLLECRARRGCGGEAERRQGSDWHGRMYLPGYWRLRC